MLSIKFVPIRAIKSYDAFMRLKGKNIILTGASSGIGLEMLPMLVAKGARVIAVARHIENIPQTEDLIYPFCADVSTKDGVDKLFEYAVQVLGRVDIFIANAGYAYLEKLNIVSFRRHKPISELVPEMIGMTQKLIDSKHAYVSDDGSVYFDIKSFKKYGNLAHLDMKGMKAGARVNNDEYDKDNISDFALWK